MAAPAAPAKPAGGGDAAAKATMPSLQFLSGVALKGDRFLIHDVSGRAFVRLRWDGTSRFLQRDAVLSKNVGCTVSGKLYWADKPADPFLADPTADVIE